MRRHYERDYLLPFLRRGVLGLNLDFLARGSRRDLVRGFRSLTPRPALPRRPERAWPRGSEGARFNWRPAILTETIRTLRA